MKDTFSVFCALLWTACGPGSTSLMEGIRLVYLNLGEG